MRIRFALLLAGTAAFAAVTAARAQEALSLTWNECVLDPTATHNRDFACSTNLGQQDLYCSLRLAAPADSVLGVEVVVDVQHADAAMPDWWKFAPGDCRAGFLHVGFDFTSNATCADFLGGNAAGGLLSYTVGQPHGGANQARILLAASILPSFGYATLTATDTYYAARLSIPNGETVSPGTVCAGCADAACLVLNSIWVRRQPGALGGDVLLTLPGTGNANWASWQGGAGADCAAVPVRSTTWGRLKGLYR